MGEHELRVAGAEGCEARDGAGAGALCTERFARRLTTPLARQNEVHHPRQRRGAAVQHPHRALRPHHGALPACGEVGERHEALRQVRPPRSWPSRHTEVPTAAGYDLRHSHQAALASRRRGIAREREHVHGQIPSREGDLGEAQRAKHGAHEVSEALATTPWAATREGGREGERRTRSTGPCCMGTTAISATCCVAGTGGGGSATPAMQPFSTRGTALQRAISNTNLNAGRR